MLTEPNDIALPQGFGDFIRQPVDPAVALGAARLTLGGTSVDDARRRAGHRRARHERRLGRGHGGGRG